MKLRTIFMTILLGLGVTALGAKALRGSDQTRVLAGKTAVGVTKSNNVITLSERNTVVLNWVVTSQSTAKAAQELLNKSRNLDPKDKMYLVLDTPGGSVDAGINFVQVVKGLPQQVDTVSLFAASMGFHIVQNLGNRYVAPNGILMSHRASGGVEGTIPGSINTTLQMWMDILQQLDGQAADRMGLTTKTYSNLIQDEYWTYGITAVRDGAADQVVQLKCDASLSGTTQVSVETLFGTYNLTYSKCPLVRGILDVKRGFYGEVPPQEIEFMKALDQFNNKALFYKNYIKTNKYEALGF